MADRRLDAEALSIVVVGSFNPAIFQPLWFSDNNLIRKEEAKEAKIEIIHNNASVFSSEWFSFQVTQGMFKLETKDPSKSLPLRDLAFGTFKVLEHTPITAFGMNSSKAFQMSSIDDWHAIGHHLAPKESWGALIMEPGLRLLIMEGKRPNCDGRIQVRVEPIETLKAGVGMSVNEHHDLAPSNRVVNSNRTFLTTLGEKWDDFLAYSEGVFAHLFSECLDRPPLGRKKKR